MGRLHVSAFYNRLNREFQTSSVENRRLVAAPWLGAIFFTRIAIVANFLDRLVDQNPFWKLLNTFGTFAAHSKTSNPESHFLRKILLILAYSTQNNDVKTKNLVSQIAANTINTCFQQDNWDHLVELISDCFMVLARSNPLKLVDSVSTHFDSIAELMNKNDVEEAETNFLRLCSSAAWSIAGAVGSGTLQLTEEARNEISEHKGKFEAFPIVGFYCVEMMESLLERDVSLKHKLGIRSWYESDNFLELLNDRNDTEIVDYLSKAPGYTCTLMSVLEICAADAILLYQRSEEIGGVENKSSGQEKFSDYFVLRAAQSSFQTATIEGLLEFDISNKVYPVEIQMAMDQQLYFESSSGSLLEEIPNYIDGREITWVFGSPIFSSDQTEQYYAILAYRKLPVNLGHFKITSFLYWKKCERLLSNILPAIHARYFKSSAAWHSLVQAVGPFHMNSIDNEKRLLLKGAFSTLNPSSLLRRALSMSRQTARNQVQVQYHLAQISFDLRDAAKEYMKGNKKSLDESPIDLTDEGWPVEPISALGEVKYRKRYFSFNETVLDFIVYECLLNSLTYFQTMVQIRTEIIDAEDGLNGSDGKLVVEISNDFQFDGAYTPDIGQVTKSGIKACKAAAIAVDGVFVSEANGAIWKSKIILPVHFVPKILRRILSAILT